MGLFNYFITNIPITDVIRGKIMRELKVTTEGTLRIGSIQVFETEPRKYNSRIPPQPPLTKKRFMNLLTKSAQLLLRFIKV